MPEKETLERAERDAREGKSPSTQAGEFVREEMHHIREGKHGASSPQQAIAIGLSEARRAGVNLGKPKRGSAKMKRQAARDTQKGQSRSRPKPSRRRSTATLNALRRKGRTAASKSALSKQGRRAASMRSASSRSLAAKRAARTKGPAGRKKAAQKASRTRAEHRRAA